jgi:hypothetical protein
MPTTVTHSLWTTTGYHRFRWMPARAAAVWARRVRGLAEAGAGLVVDPHKEQPWAEITTDPVLLDMAGWLLGCPVAVHSSLLLVKRPGDSWAVPAHQDGVDEGQCLDPDRSLSMWLALDPAGTASGGLSLAPGSHRGGYWPHARDTDTSGGRGAPLRLVNTAGLHFAPIPVPAGMAVALDSRTVHLSTANTTSRPRAALNVRYVTP